MRIVAVFAALAFVALLQGAASARTMRVCDDIANRCESAREPRSGEVERRTLNRREKRVHRELDSTELAAPLTIVTPNKAATSRRPPLSSGPKGNAKKNAGYDRGELDETDLIISDNRPIIMASRVATDDATTSSAYVTAGFSSGDATGLTPWSNVLAIVLGSAGVLSLLLAKAADA